MLGSNVTLNWMLVRTGANFSSGTTLTAFSPASISASGITGTVGKLSALRRAAGAAIDFGIPNAGWWQHHHNHHQQQAAGPSPASVGNLRLIKHDWATVSGNGTISALVSYKPDALPSEGDVDSQTGTSTPGNTGDQLPSTSTPLTYTSPTPAVETHSQ